MIDILQQLGGGFISVFQPINLFALVVGLVVGMLVAVLPGLTLVMGVVICYAALIVLLNFLADIAYSLLDPRVRHS